MENHPLTPMTDANLVRVLSRQTDGTVGLVPFAAVERGAAAIRDAMTALKEQGRRYAIVDAVTDAICCAIGEAAAAHALITGGSGVALGLPANFRRAGLLPVETIRPRCRSCTGTRAVLAGSCSRATLLQVGRARDHLPVLELDPLALPTRQRWRGRSLGRRDTRRRADRDRRIGAAGAGRGVAGRLGRDAAGALVEDALSPIAEHWWRAASAAGGCGRRNLGRRGDAAWRASLAHRRRDRSRRALDLCRRQRRAAAAGAEVRQFRRAPISS